MGLRSPIDTIGGPDATPASPASGRRPLDPPCALACASHEPVREWLFAGQHDGPAAARAAWELIVAANPLPACMGRICYANCEQACVLTAHGGPVTIRELEGRLGDLAIEQGWELPRPAASLGTRVVVVGSGPCGISAAHQLARAGHDVTLVEAQARLGGMLRRGISEQRLPKAVLDAELDRLLALGVRVRTHAAVRRIEDVLDRADGVIWAAGASTCMAIVRGRTLWRQPIHTDARSRRTATLSIGRGARAAAALTAHLTGAEPPPAPPLPAFPAGGPAPVPPQVTAARRCILCGSRGTLRP